MYVIIPGQIRNEKIIRFLWQKIFSYRTTVEGFKAPARWVRILDGYKALLSLARATDMLQKASKVLLFRGLMTEKYINIKTTVKPLIT